MEERAIVPRRRDEVLEYLQEQYRRMDRHIGEQENRLNEVFVQLQSWGSNEAFKQWVDKVNHLLEELESNLFQERTDREGCQAGHEEDVGKIREDMQTLKEQLLAQMAEDDTRIERNVSDKCRDLSSKLETRLSALDSKCGVALKAKDTELKRHLEERLEMKEAEMLSRMEELKGKISDTRGKLDLMEIGSLAKGETTGGTQFSALLTRVHALSDQLQNMHATISQATDAKLLPLQTDITAIRLEMEDIAAGSQASALNARMDRLDTQLASVKTAVSSDTEARLRTFQANVMAKIQEDRDSLRAEMIQMISQANVQRPPTPSVGLFGGPSQSGQPIVPPIQVHSDDKVTSVLKWSRRLDKLNFQSVKTFIKQLKQFQDATGISDGTARTLLFQQADGAALRFLESLPDSLGFEDVLRRLKERVKPPDTVALRRLLDCKQKSRETIQDFAMRWRTLAESYPDALINTSELRTIIVDNMSDRWRATARSMVMRCPSLTVDQLLRDLIEIEGPSEDVMEIDAVRPSEQTVDISTGQQPQEIGRVVLSGGMINWPEVRDVQSFMMAWRQLCKSDRDIRSECVRWLNVKPNNSYGRPGFNGRRDNRGGRKIYNVRDEVP